MAKVKPLTRKRVTSPSLVILLIITMIKLSILIPSVHTRRNTFLPKIQDEVFRQIELLNPDLQQQVEVLILTDNKRMMLGEKRNRLVELSQGMYYVFIDDDDRIASTYVSDILNATSSGSDVITFKAMVKINDEDKKVCVYSKEFDSDENTEESYHRLPNHICAVRRDIGRQVSFPNIKYGEDSAILSFLSHFLKVNILLIEYCTIMISILILPRLRSI